MDLGPKLILDEGLFAAIEEVGRRFENQEFFLPEMMVSASAMKSGLAELGPSGLDECTPMCSGSNCAPDWVPPIFRYLAESCEDVRVWRMISECY